MSTLAQAVQPFVEKNFIAGAVLLAATRERVLACETVGYADLASKTPMTPETMFWIASMTKPMTGTALMMLVDEGKVKVDEPVETYLPEFRGQMVVAHKDEEAVLLRKPRHPILVREVLNHTAGLAFTSPMETPTLDHLSVRDSVRSHAMLPLNSEPGTRYMYSNAGTNTAGRIIEVVTGEAYEAFMDARLFHPLGMTDTTFWPSEEQVARMAKIYATNEEKTGLKEARLAQLSHPFTARERQPLPAGGLFSTAADCARFCQMLLNGGVAGGRRYISEESIAQMTTKQTGPEVETPYGFGWFAAEGKYSHGGACKTNMTVDSARGLVMVFLIHHTNDWPNDEARTIGDVFTAAAEKLVA